jgi:hypothetical protein
MKKENFRPNSKMQFCPTCRRQSPPKGRTFRKIPIAAQDYCKCFQWETMLTCLVLSVINAWNLLYDAGLLYDMRRLSRAVVLVSEAIEELGMGQRVYLV